MLGYGGFDKYFSRESIIRVNQFLLNLDLPSVFSESSSAAWASSSAIGCFGGVPAKALETASR